MFVGGQCERRSTRKITSGLNCPRTGRPVRTPLLHANHLSRSNPAIIFSSPAFLQHFSYPSLTPFPHPPGTIGITTFAASALGDVVYVELPTPSQTVTAGDTIGAVESVKSASDIMTPVTGKIIEGNSVLEEKPGTINKGPEGEGWIARIEVGEEGRAEVEGLMGGGEYGRFVGAEGGK